MDDNAGNARHAERMRRKEEMVDEKIAGPLSRPEMQHGVVAGRAAPMGRVAAADTVTGMNAGRHALKAGIAARPGVQW